ncbi:MAG: WecB/TagA/CpsF family glycosyltransferase [Candidatus Magasanikbacteria bacterium]
MHKKVLGVKISKRDKEESRELVRENLQKNDKTNYIFTPNAEMLVDAYRDDYFRMILNKSELNLCDSKGINFFNFNAFNRITGVDFMQEMLKVAEKMDKSVYLLGSGDNRVVKRLKKEIKREHPDIKISGTHPGPKIELIQENGINKIGVDEDKNNKIVHELVMKSPDIVFVAFGHLKQEMWIYNYLSDIPEIKLAMGVGGAFDYLSNEKDRAPRWVRNLGFEWLYRLIKEPKRLKRIMKAVVVFPVLHVWDKIKSLFSYK